MAFSSASHVVLPAHGAALRLFMLRRSFARMLLACPVHCVPFFVSATFSGLRLLDRFFCPLRTRLGVCACCVGLSGAAVVSSVVVSVPSSFAFVLRISVLRFCCPLRRLSLSHGGTPGNPTARPRVGSQAVHVWRRYVQRPPPKRCHHVGKDSVHGGSGVEQQTTYTRALQERTGTLL